MKLKILELSNGNQLVSALERDVLINDNGEIKTLSPSFELSNKIKVQQLPIENSSDLLISYVVSSDAKNIISALNKQYKGQVKVITSFANVLLLKGITRSLREDDKLSPSGKTIYKSSSFVGYR